MEDIKLGEFIGSPDVFRLDTGEIQTQEQVEALGGFGIVEKQATVRPGIIEESQFETFAGTSLSSDELSKFLGQLSEPAQDAIEATPTSDPIVSGDQPLTASFVQEQQQAGTTTSTDEAQPINVTLITPQGGVAQQLTSLDDIQTGQRVKFPGSNEQFIKTSSGFFVAITADDLTRLTNTGELRPDLFELPQDQFGALQVSDSGQVGSSTVGVAADVGEDGTTGATKTELTIEDALREVERLQSLVNTDFSGISTEIDDILNQFGDLNNVSASEIFQQELERVGLGEGGLQTVQSELNQVILDQTKMVRELPQAIKESLQDVGVSAAQLKRIVARDVQPKAEVLRDLLEQRGVLQSDINTALSFAEKFANTRLEDKAFNFSILKVQFDAKMDQFKDMRDDQRQTVSDAINLIQTQFENELSVAREQRLQETADLNAALAISADERASVTFQTETINGRIVRIGFDTFGNEMSRNDLGADTSGGTSTLLSDSQVLAFNDRLPAGSNVFLPFGSTQAQANAMRASFVPRELSDTEFFDFIRTQETEDAAIAELSANTLVTNKERGLELISTSFAARKERDAITSDSGSSTELNLPKQIIGDAPFTTSLAEIQKTALEEEARIAEEEASAKVLEGIEEFNRLFN